MSNTYVHSCSITGRLSNNSGLSEPPFSPIVHRALCPSLSAESQGFLTRVRVLGSRLDARLGCPSLGLMYTCTSYTLILTVQVDCQNWQPTSWLSSITWYVNVIFCEILYFNPSLFRESINTCLSYRIFWNLPEYECFWN